MPRYTKRSKYAIYPHSNNSEEHEVFGKSRLCYWLRKSGEAFITEAVCPKGFQHDVISLDTGISYEIEMTPKRAERFKNEVYKDCNIIVVKMWKDKLVKDYINEI